MDLLINEEASEGNEEKWIIENSSLLISMIRASIVG